MLLVHQWRSAIGGLARRSHCRASQSVTQCVCEREIEREREGGDDEGSLAGI